MILQEVAAHASAAPIRAVRLRDGARRPRPSPDSSAPPMSTDCVPGPSAWRTRRRAHPGVRAGPRAYWNDAQQSHRRPHLGSPTLAVAYVIGAFLGVPIVGRELERGTTRLAWSLAPSRWRWFAARGCCRSSRSSSSLTFVAGAAVDRFFAASVQGEDPARRSPCTGLAAACSPAGRRSSSASRSSSERCRAGAAGVDRDGAASRPSRSPAARGSTRSSSLRNEAVPVETRSDENGTRQSRRLYLRHRLPAPGRESRRLRVLRRQRDPFDENTGDADATRSSRWSCRAAEYRFVEAREAAALVGASLVALLFAGVVVARRRPG